MPAPSVRQSPATLTALIPLGTSAIGRHQVIAFARPASRTPSPSGLARSRYGPVIGKSPLDWAHPGLARRALRASRFMAPRSCRETPHVIPARDSPVAAHAVAQRPPPVCPRPPFLHSEFRLCTTVLDSVSRTQIRSSDARGKCELFRTVPSASWHRPSTAPHSTVGRTDVVSPTTPVGIDLVLLLVFAGASVFRLYATVALAVFLGAVNEMPAFAGGRPCWPTRQCSCLCHPIRTHSFAAPSTGVADATANGRSSTRRSSSTAGWIQISIVDCSPVSRRSPPRQVC